MYIRARLFRLEQKLIIGQPLVIAVDDGDAERFSCGAKTNDCPPYPCHGWGKCPFQNPKCKGLYIQIDYGDDP